MTAEADLAALYAAEAAFWKDRAGELEEMLRDVSIVLGKTQITAGPPPEPPIGTAFWRDGRPAWERRADGWYCRGNPDPDPECETCPVSWFEVWDIGGVTAPRVRRFLPGEAES